jgi:hypothetical protein
VQSDCDEEDKGEEEGTEEDKEESEEECDEGDTSYPLVQIGAWNECGIVAFLYL